MREKLTDAELEEYLQEVNDIAKEHLREQNALSDVSVELGPPKPPKHVKTSQARGSRDERRLERREVERATIQEALSQTYLDLKTAIGAENKKWLIAKLTEGFTDNMNRYKLYIEHTIDSVLRKYIPTDIMKNWQRYPETMVPFPGFEYQCSEDFGEGKTFFVSLDLPMYFRPEICQELFCEHCPSKVPRLEKSIALFHYHKEARTATQVKYARNLTTVVSFYHLLKRKPYWYHLLVEHLKEKNGWTYQP